MTNSMTQTAVLYLRFFGQVKIEVAGEEIPIGRWKSKKALNLLKYLALKDGKKVPKETLIDLFWSVDDDIEEYVHRLHSTIYFLRKTLQQSNNDISSCICYSDGLYWLENNDSIWVDVLEFEKLYILSNKVHNIDPARAITGYKEALSLYTDDLFVETENRIWLIPFLEYYHELFIQITKNLTELLIKNGAIAEAIHYYQNALKIDPYCEEIHRCLFVLYVQSKLYAEAARQYHQFANAISRKPGATPSLEMRRMYEQLRQMESKIDSTQIPIGISLTQPGPLVCDNMTFCSIYNLELRRQCRSRKTMALVTVIFRPYNNDGVKAAVVEVLCKSLRQSDVLCNDSDEKIVLQFHDINEHDIRIVKKRLERLLLPYGDKVEDITYRVISPVDGQNEKLNS